MDYINIFRNSICCYGSIEPVGVPRLDWNSGVFNYRNCRQGLQVKPHSTLSVCLILYLKLLEISIDYLQIFNVVLISNHRLTVGIILVLWVSGICSAFIDNIPFTTMMIPVITDLSESMKL